MLFGWTVIGILSLLLLVYTVLDVATTPRHDVQGLPKPLWFVVALFPVLGPSAWFIWGRPSVRTAPPTRRPAPPVFPDDDEAFLRELRRRAEEQRRRGEQQRDEGGPAA